METRMSDFTNSQGINFDRTHAGCIGVGLPGCNTQVKLLALSVFLI